MNVSNIIIQTLNSPEVVKVISMGSVLIVIGFGLKVITKISDIQMEHGNVAASASLKMISTLVHYMVLLALLVGVIDGYSRIIGNVITTFGIR